MKKETGERQKKERRLSHRDLFQIILKEYSQNEDCVFGVEEYNKGIKYFKAKEVLDEVSNFKKEVKGFLKKEKRILDIGAGTGKLSIFLQKEKYNVFALDDSEVACWLMKKRGVKNVIFKNFFRFLPDKRFNYALVFDNPSFFGKNSEDFEKFFCHLKNSILSKGGRIIITAKLFSRNRDKTLKSTKRRFIFKNLKGAWYSSIYQFDPLEFIKFAAKLGWKLDKFEKKGKECLFVLKQEGVDKEKFVISSFLEKELKSILKSQNKTVKRYLFLVTKGFFIRSFGFLPEKSEKLAREILRGLRGGVTLQNSESWFKKATQKKEVRGARIRRGKKRVEFYSGIINRYIKGGEILDYGAGSGLLGEEISKDFKKKVVLTDIAKRNQTNLPFFISKGTTTPFPDKRFDTTLVFSVLHHVQRLKKLLKEIKRITKKRIIVSEIVYHGKEISPNEKISKEEHRGITFFQEWLYCSPNHYGTEFYFKPRTPREWKKIFKEAGFKLVKEVDLSRLKEDLERDIIYGFHPWLFILDI